jgi:hypothetical protein
MDRRELLKKLCEILDVKSEFVPDTLAKLKREVEDMEIKIKSTD